MNHSKNSIEKAIIFLIDDDPSILEVLSLQLKLNGFHCIQAQNSLDALQIMAETFSQSVTNCMALVDIRLGDENGIELLQRLKAKWPQLPVVMMTAHGDIDTAVESFQKGAAGYIRKPFREGEVLAQVTKMMEVSSHSQLSVEDTVTNISELQTLSPLMKNLTEQIHMASAVQTNVVIYGESGSGKELVAKTLHSHGPRKDGHFVAINCGAFPENLLETELFGHVKGAFTDAKSDKVGLIQKAHQGSLFLDEIGDAPLSIQVRLLRAIQEKEILPVGATETIKVDVRFIAATHKNLKELIKQGLFREDLFFRLQVIPLQVPALRERPEDIMLLAKQFARQFALSANKIFEGFTERAIEGALSYPWPGNVRELQNRIERATVMNPKALIDLEDLFPEVNAISKVKVKSDTINISHSHEGLQTTLNDRTAMTDPFFGQTREENFFQKGIIQTNSELPSFKAAKEHFEREYVMALLERAQGNITLAAKLAQKSRPEIYNLIKKHGITQ